MDDERWAQLERSNYEISNMGRVRRASTSRVLKPRPNNRGYYYIRLSIGGRPQHVSIHRAVAKAFLPNPLNLDTVDHRDRDKANNLLSNLQWMDGRANLRKDQVGTPKNYGSINGRARLTENAVRQAREQYRLGVTVEALAEALYVTTQTVYKALSGVTWRHVK